MGVNPVPYNIPYVRTARDPAFIRYKNPLPTVIPAQAGIQPSSRIHFHRLVRPFLATVIPTDIPPQ